MYKKSQKGFLLAESLIVATFVITVLIFLFIQFKNLSSSFDSSFKYNTVEGLYALDNVKTYLKENASDDLKISTALGNNTYIMIYNGTACNTEIGLRGTSYCKELMDEQGIKKVIFTRADITNNVDGVVSLKNRLRTTNDTFFSENMKNFILRVNVKGINHTYRLIAEFKDGSFATFNVGDENWSSSKYNDPDYVDPNYDKSATSTTCFKTKAVTDGVELTGYTCADKTIKIPSKFNDKRLVGIGDYALQGHNLTSVTFPNGIKYIGNDAVSTNNLTSVEIPLSVIRIGERAFKGNAIAGTLTIPDNVSIINNSAFESNKIAAVKLGAGVATVGDAAFYNNAITKIDFNKFLNNIGNNAFASNKISNSSTENFTVPNSVSRIGSGAFRTNQITRILIPESVTYIGDKAFEETTKWSNIEIDGENPYRFNGRWLEIGWPIDKLVGTQGFNYSGGSQTYEVKLDGYYKVELWGAQGSSAKNGDTVLAAGGKGGYTSGIAYFNAKDKLYFYVGNVGSTANPGTTTAGGWNGGGAGTVGNASSDATARYVAGAGGGGTDVRLNGTGLANRIMVAGAGGGGANTAVGGTGGGLWGNQSGGSAIGNNGTVGKQTMGNAFGVGKSGTGVGAGYGVAGAGGGYYGGSNLTSGANTAGGGGSSFISGFAGSNGVNSSSGHINDVYQFSGTYFVDTKMFNGSQSMPNAAGTGTETGHSGHGNARITYIGDAKPESSSLLRKVQYVRDCINGSSANTGNHWLEIQAIADGKNVAKGKLVTGTLGQANSTTYAFANAVDGKFDVFDGNSNFAYMGGSGPQCLTINLGKEYNLEEIAVWHYFGDPRTYKEHVISVGNGSAIYRTIRYAETSVAETHDGLHVK